MEDLTQTVTELEQELEAALSDNDELAHRIGELEDQVEVLRTELRETATHDETKLFGGTD